ncbi:MAG TPA: N-acetylmuramoyl-L-alanine amidase-like domain-containing protein [Longimicrobium sp.]|uniref:N-acetylmuramoyl-L-alanine amidase-like domain-containing protein n=1 Tax=Longimicrobium sp. TaxID=2029185 RepID=UPI002EDA6A50
MTISRRSFLARAAATAAATLAGAPAALHASPPDDRARLAEWVRALRTAGATNAGTPFGPWVARAGERMIGAPYAANTLEQYLAQGGSADAEPLTLDLARFDCVSLVESALAVARTAAAGEGGWDRFAREVERMRYRGGRRQGYASRLHYFSEWIADGARRGLVRDLGPELGGERDVRPLRFMTEHRASYAALRDDAVFRAIAERERALDASVRTLVPTDRIARVQDRVQSGDVLAFATSIPGLDVTHTGLAHRGADGVLRVLHAPLSGGAVEISRSTLPEYVAAIRRATGILIARPLKG